MVDTETRHIIDILESRETDDVARWLATYPNIQVVSRDGSQMYAAAIRKAHPNAVQVSDRFHLVKNLTDAAKHHISKILGTSFRISAVEVESGSSGGYFEKEEYLGADLPERQHTASVEKKRAVIGKVRELVGKGLSITAIAKETGISPQTAKKYTGKLFNPENAQYGGKRASKIKAYTAEIDALLRKRYKFKDIENTIRKKGYDGASSTIRMYATRQRRFMKAAFKESIGATELIERKWVTKLLYQPMEKVKGITESQIERIIGEYPVVGVLYDIVRSFKEIMFAKRVHKIDSWIEVAASYGIDEITGFIKGISGDLEAVKNAVQFEYSNGLAEGSVNKLKLIKRIMYGRSSFKMLRNKILLLEANRTCN
jgi:transposase